MAFGRTTVGPWLGLLEKQGRVAGYEGRGILTYGIGVRVRM